MVYSLLFRVGVEGSGRAAGSLTDNLHMLQDQSVVFKMRALSVNSSWFSFHRFGHEILKLKP